MKNIVLITGGGKRLGSLIAKELSKESFHIVLHYNKSEKQALETKDEIIKNGGKIDLIRKEITSENDAMDLIGESINFLEDVENQNSHSLIMLQPLNMTKAMISQKIF